MVAAVGQDQRMDTTRIFVSYSHEDARWVQAGEQFDLVPWLAHSLAGDQVEFWFDHALRKLPGIEYRQKIEAEIDAAHFALVLISLDFLVSPFIREVELPRIRRRVEAGEMAIIPILVGPVEWEDDENMRWLKARQMLPGKPTPLIEYTSSLPQWQRVRADIWGAIRSRVQDLRRSRAATPAPAPRAEAAPAPPAAPAAVRLAAPTKPAVAPAASVRPGELVVPSFHYGGVVPPEYFVGRARELQAGSDLIHARQSFLLVGDFRSGKTSYGKMLIHRLMAENDVSPVRVLCGYFNLQECVRITPETFLGRTVRAASSEIARQVFGCKYTLIEADPYQVHPELRDDRAFGSFMQVCRVIRQRTLGHGAGDVSPLAPEEFVQFIQDLMEILREKGWDEFFIFYDEANRLPMDFSIDLLTGNVEALTAAGVISVYSVVPQAAETDALRNLFGHHVRLVPFADVGEVRALLARYCFQDESRIADLPVTPAAIEALWHCTGGRPFRVQVLAGHSFRLAHDRGAPAVTDEHVRESLRALQEQGHPAFLDGGQVRDPRAG